MWYKLSIINKRSTKGSIFKFYSSDTENQPKIFLSPLVIKKCSLTYLRHFFGLVLIAENIKFWVFFFFFFFFFTQGSKIYFSILASIGMIFNVIWVCLKCDCFVGPNPMQFLPYLRLPHQDFPFSLKPIQGIYIGQIFSSSNPTVYHKLHYCNFVPQIVLDCTNYFVLLIITMIYNVFFNGFYVFKCHLVMVQLHYTLKFCCLYGISPALW